MVNLDTAAMLRDVDLSGMEELASSITKDANKGTSAPVGIAWRWLDEETIRVGPRGAPAIVKEFGGRTSPPRRMVKKALDRHRQR